MSNNSVCSGFKGTRKPLIMAESISNSSPTPLYLHSLWIKTKRRSHIAFRIIFLLETSYAYCLIYFGIKFMKNIFEILSFAKFWIIKQFQILNI